MLCLITVTCWWKTKAFNDQQRKGYRTLADKLNTIQQKKKQEKDAEIIKLRPVPRDYRGYWIIQELREANKEFKDKLAMNPVFLWEYAIGGFQLGLMVVTL